MNLKKLIFTNNRCYKAGKTIKPKGIMVHSTGANNPNLKRYVGPDDGLLGKNTNNNHWNKSDLSVCVHAFIGKLKDGSIATYQVLPWCILSFVNCFCYFFSACKCLMDVIQNIFFTYHINDTCLFDSIVNAFVNA